jgi:hypothetical protein
MRATNVVATRDLRCTQLHEALAPRYAHRTGLPMGIHVLRQRIHLAHAGLDQITVQGSLQKLVEITQPSEQTRLLPRHGFRCRTFLHSMQQIRSLILGLLPFRQLLGRTRGHEFHLDHLG